MKKKEMGRCVVCGGNKKCAPKLFVENVHWKNHLENLGVVTKVKFTLEQATKGQRGSSCIALPFC